jgi:hypothetical protein
VVAPLGLIIDYTRKIGHRVFSLLQEWGEASQMRRRIGRPFHMELILGVVVHLRLPVATVITNYKV